MPIFSRVHTTLQVTVSVCQSVGLSHFAFFAFLGYSKVGKHIFEYLVSYKQHSRLYKSPYWSVGLSVFLSRSAFFHFSGYLKVGKHKFKCLVLFKEDLRPYKSPCWSVGPSVCLSRCQVPSSLVSPIRFPYFSCGS